MSTRRTLFTALLATALSLPVWAQPATPPAETPAPAPAAPAATPAVAPAAPAATPAVATPAAAAPVVTVQGAAPVAAPVTRDKDTLSVDFPDEDIKTILRNVADLFELNLVVPESLTGKTSIKLRDVTWRQIFQVVLSPAGYTYVEEGNIIKIVSNELLQQEPGSTEVFILNNAKAADIKPTIDGLIDAATGGKIVIDARSNSLVITERPSRMSRIRTIIEQLDKATDQVMIESKFVEVTDRDTRNIGVNWSGLDHLQLGAGSMSQTFSRDRGQTIGNGNGSTNSDTLTTTNTGPINTTTTTNTAATTTGTTTTSSGDLLTFDKITGAPLVTTIPPISNTSTVITPATSTTVTTSSPATTGYVENIANSLNSLMNIANTGGTSRVATAVFSASDFNVILSALKTLDNTKIVSNPTIVTLNNTEATLNIGEEFPVPSYTYNSERGSFEVSGFAYKPIGVILKVTPQVNARGIVKMTIEPEVSQRNGATSFGGAGGASIPIIATRKAKTQVSLKDGYTMGIGGLITTSQDHGGTKVPLLGDIPLLGKLFSSKTVNDVSSNLLIFITAKTVSADGASPEEVFDPRSVQAVGMSRDELPGYRASKGTDIFAPADKKK
jgi:type IV pilus assembly protein PilQ